VGLLVVVLSGCAGLTPVSVRRSQMVPLPHVPAVQVIPQETGALWAGAQAAPVVVESNPNTGDQIPTVQPELGGLALIKDHFLIGGSTYFSTTSWAKKASATQLGFNGNSFSFGIRARVGGTLAIDNGFGIMWVVEPGVDAIPWVTDGVSSDSTRYDVSFSSTLAPFWERGPVRLFMSLTGGTLPSTTATVTVPAGCSGCAEPGGTYVSFAAVATGASVALGRSWSLSGSVMVPLTRSELGYAPMFALALATQLHRDADPPDPSTPSRPLIESEEPPPPPLIEAPPKSPPGQPLQL
jgi:hypothetical protein